VAPRAGVLKNIIAVSLILAAGAEGAEKPAWIEIPLPPSPEERCFTSFLVTPVRVAAAPADADPAGWGEGAPSPFGDAWRAAVSSSPRMVELEPPGVYAACCRLLPPRPGTYRFRFGSYADGAVYAGGREIARFPPDPEYWIRSTEFSLKLPAQGAWILLLVGSRYGRCGFYLRTENPGVRAVLPLRNVPLRREKLAAAGLRCIPLHRFVRRDEPLTVAITKEAGIPPVGRTLSVTVEYRSPEGEVLHVSRAETPRLDTAGRDILSLAWRAPRKDFCRIQARVVFRAGGKHLREKICDFYVPEAIRSRLRVLKARVAEAERAAGRALPLAGLMVEQAEILSGKTFLTPAAGKETIGLLERVPAVLEAERAGRDPLKGARGYIERAYFSPIDCSYQPYRVYVPRGYRPGRPTPLFVYLHGYVPSYTKAEWVEEPASLTRLMEKHSCLLAVPFGRSNTDFQTVGEVDVFRVVHEMKRLYTVDPRRVYLVGYSMGGSGMWTLMQHAPGVFAAGVSIGGRTDYYFWKDLDRGNVPPYKRFLIDNNNPITAVENFLNAAFWIFHGEHDPLVKIGHSTRMHAALAKAGIESRLTVIPNRMHWIADTVWREYDIVSWALEHVLPACPWKVSFVTYTPKYRRAWWVEILGFARWGRPARVVASCGPGDACTVTAENTLGVRIRLPAALRGKKEVRVVFNGAENTHPVQPDGTMILGTGEKGGGFSKNRLPGPLKEAFNSPFTVVWGPRFEGGSYREEAEAFAAEWEAFAKGRPPLVRDTEMKPETAARRNLVIFSDPVEGSLLARLLPRTPVRITPERFAVGPRSASRRRRGIAFVYPNPEHPERYIAVFSGLRWGTSLPVNHKFDHVPDYIVFGADTHEDGSNREIFAGFFDMRWRYARELSFTRDR